VGVDVQASAFSGATVILTCKEKEDRDGGEARLVAIAVTTRGKRMRFLCSEMCGACGLHICRVGCLAFRVYVVLTLEDRY